MGDPKFDVGVADTQANEVVGAPMVGWCGTPTVASEMNLRNGGMPFANPAKYYATACAKNHRENGDLEWCRQKPLLPVRVERSDGAGPGALTHPL